MYCTSVCIHVKGGSRREGERRGGTRTRFGQPDTSSSGKAIGSSYAAIQTEYPYLFELVSQPMPMDQLG